MLAHIDTENRNLTREEIEATTFGDLESNALPVRHHVKIDLRVGVCVGFWVVDGEGVRLVKSVEPMQVQCGDRKWGRVPRRRDYAGRSRVRMPLGR